MPKYLSVFVMNVYLIISSVLALVLCVVIAFTLWFYFKVNKYLISKKGSGLIKYLNEVEEKEDSNTKKISELKKVLDLVKKKDLEHIQKIGLVRFNPFNETGGDHSFSLCLLDDLGSGVIITSLHSRERTRVYLKEMVKGEANLALSKEEKQAINKALV